MKKSVSDIDVGGHRVLVRLDLNVPLDRGQRITDDRRIRAALPTIRRLIENGGRLVLMSHLGRPQDAPEDRKTCSLAPVAQRLAELLDQPVPLVGDCVGDVATRAVAQLDDGRLCLLENLRFHAAETIKDKKADQDPQRRAQKDAFAARLASLGDAYVNDAFGTCHRDNASMVTVPRMMTGKPKVVGYLVQRELQFLGQAISEPARPFVCILGGAKVSDKLALIHLLLARCDTILIGGAMAYTFLASQGVEVGESLVEPDLFGVARALRAQAGDRLKLPIDSVCALEIRAGVKASVCEGSIPADRMGLDIGPQTIAAYSEILATARTVVWNGPMGVFETPPFDRGTLALASVLADATDRGAVTIIGGGDSAAAIDRAGVADRMTHISTGGGASLAFLEGKPLPAIDVLDDRL